MTLEPSRISLARQRAGLSKTEMAERLGTTARTVTNYESDGAPERMASFIARVLSCRPEYLRLPPTSTLDEDQVFFRARRKSTAAEKHAAAAVGRSGVELYRLITSYFGLPEVNLPDLSPLDPVLAAQHLRAEWGLGIDVLPNLVRLAESKGVKVLSLPSVAENVDAFSFWEDGVPFVFLSMAKTGERSRFDLAHEIGHLVLHGGLENSMLGERNAEREADQFASELLMPQILLKSLARIEPSIERVLEIKAYLRVSAMATVYGLHKAGLLSDWSYRRHCVELTKRGYRVEEPDGIVRENSRVFDTVFGALRKSKGWTMADIGNQLALSPADVRGLTFGQRIVEATQGSLSYAKPERSKASLQLVR